MILERKTVKVLSIFRAAVLRNSRYC